MSVIAEIEAGLSSGTVFTIAQLGGAAAIAAEADALVKAPYLDVLVSLASSADTKDESILDALGRVIEVNEATSWHQPSARC